MYNAQKTFLRIKQLAKEKNISMAQLQESCEISKNTISQSAKSQEGMKAKNLYTISEVLDCSIDYLLGKTDEPNSHYTNVTTGNIKSGNNSNNNSTVSIGASTQDSTTQQFITIFNELTFEDKAKLINSAIELKNKEN